MNRSIANPIGDVFKYLAISILFCFIGYGFGVAFVPEYIINIANIIIVIMIIAMLATCFISRKGIIKSRFSMNWVYLFTFIEGITLYPIIQMYVGEVGTKVVINVLIVTFLIFVVMYQIFKRTDSRKYLSWGPGLFLLLIILIPFNIISIGLSVLVGFETLEIAVSSISIILFTCYIMYDLAVLKEAIENENITDSKDLSIYVLNLFLDFINIFIDLLRLVSVLKD